MSGMAQCFGWPSCHIGLERRCLVTLRSKITSGCVLPPSAQQQARGRKDDCDDTRTIVNLFDDVVFYRCGFIYREDERIVRKTEAIASTLRRELRDNVCSGAPKSSPFVRELAKAEKPAKASPYAPGGRFEDLGLRAKASPFALGGRLASSLMVREPEREEEPSKDPWR